MIKINKPQQTIADPKSRKSTTIHTTTTKRLIYKYRKNAVVRSTHSQINCKSRSTKQDLNLGLFVYTK